MARRKLKNKNARNIQKSQHTYIYFMFEDTEGKLNNKYLEFINKLTVVAVASFILPILYLLVAGFYGDIIIGPIAKVFVKISIGIIFNTLIVIPLYIKVVIMLSFCNWKIKKFLLPKALLKH